MRLRIDVFRRVDYAIDRGRSPCLLDGRAFAALGQLIRRRGLRHQDWLRWHRRQEAISGRCPSAKKPCLPPRGRGCCHQCRRRAAADLLEQRFINARYSVATASLRCRKPGGDGGQTLQHSFADTAAVGDIARNVGPADLSRSSRGRGAAGHRSGAISVLGVATSLGCRSGGCHRPCRFRFGEVNAPKIFSASSIVVKRDRGYVLSHCFAIVTRTPPRRRPGASISAPGGLGISVYRKWLSGCGRSPH